MKKYTVTKAFSIMEKALLIPEDEIYAELAISHYKVFNPKTRKYIGSITQEKFKESTTETINFKIYDNSEVKKEFVEFANSMIKQCKKSYKAIDCINAMLVFVHKKF